MYLSHWEPPGVSERRRGVNLEATTSGKIQTVGGHCGRHQQKTFPSGRHGSVGVDAHRQSRQRHPGGGLLRAWCPDHGSHHISPSDRHFTVSSRSLDLIFYTNTLALWPTVTIRRNGFIGYTLASRLPCNEWRCKNVSSRSFYIRLEQRRKVSRYDTTRPWGSTQLRGSRTERVRPKIGNDRVWIFIVW